LRIRIYAISHAPHDPNKIFVGMSLAAANRRDRSIKAFYHDSGALTENFDSVFSRDK
jgi:hypothetical protein